MTLIAPMATTRDEPPSRVRRATGPERLQVLARLLGRDRDHAARFVALAAQERLSLDLLWGSFDHDGRVEAAVLLTPYPGRTAMLTLSCVRDSSEESAAEETVRVALEASATLDLAIVQALLDPRHVVEGTALRRAGFRPLATLASMERTTPRSTRGAAAAAPALPAGTSIERYDDSTSARASLAALLESTYRDTLDCPGLAGLRSASDILEGHRRGGRFDPALWSILTIEGAPVGALLLNPALHVQALELVYLGLVPSARGLGLGRLLIERAMAIAGERSVRSVMLAVDEANAPALRLYRAAGFRRISRRAAFVRPLTARAAG